MRPLKQPDSGSIVDPLLVDDMFYQIPEILEHHELFLEQVSACVDQWHHTQTVGHIFIQAVSSADSTAQHDTRHNTTLLYMLLWTCNSSGFSIDGFLFPCIRLKLMRTRCCCSLRVKVHKASVKTLGKHTV